MKYLIIFSFFSYFIQATCLPITSKKIIAEGIEYMHLYTQKSFQASVHLLFVDPLKVSIQAKAAENKCLSRKRTTEIAQQYNALAAINGSYSSSQGIPSHILKIDGAWFSDQRRARAAIGWKKDGSKTLIDIVNTKLEIIIDKQTYVIDRLNQKNTIKHTILYSPVFDDTVSIHKENIVITIASNIITNIQQGQSDMPIPKNGYLLSIGHECEQTFSNIEVGQHATIAKTIIPQHAKDTHAWNQVDYIVGGTPLLVKDGKKIEDFSVEHVLQSFLEQHYPRTAIGILPDNRWLLAVIDERNGKAGAGVSIPELAELLYSLSCIDAFNLCGNKSSTMFVESKMVSHAFSYMLNILGIFVGEKTVSDAIVVCSKN